MTYYFIKCAVKGDAMHDVAEPKSAPRGRCFPVRVGLVKRFYTTPLSVTDGVPDINSQGVKVATMAVSRTLEQLAGPRGAPQ